ncbi:MAG: MATE family efflux transporter [Polyangiaceae bacterium]|nr:MATE family efflux transporter [Polyangiaceae bacterium]
MAAPLVRTIPRAVAMHPRRTPASPLVEEGARLSVLAGPLVLANLGQIVLTMVEATAAGHLGALELGAVGLGSTLFFTVAVPATGLLLGFEPLIAQAVGAARPTQAGHLAGSAVGLALAVGSPLALLGGLMTNRLEMLGIPEAIAQAARGYLIVRLAGLVPHLVFVGLRSHAQASGHAPAVLAATATATAIHLPLTFLLVFGDRGLEDVGLRALGCPAFGLPGAAAATVAACSVACLMLAASLRRHAVPGRAPTRPDRFPWSALRLGGPIALGMFAEQGVFTLVNLALGALLMDALAPHQVAMTYVGGVFMVPIALGAAAGVRVGLAVGRGDVAAARRAGGAAAGGAAAAMSLVALALLLAPGALAKFVTTDADVVRAATPLLRIAACFVIVDGLAVTLGGALRGASDTRFACLVTVGGHYLIGLPLGGLLAFPAGFGAAGLWWGLTAGLVVISVALAGRFATLGRGRIRRA